MHQLNVIKFKIKDHLKDVFFQMTTFSALIIAIFTA